jgi:hypothetical protein
MNNFDDYPEILSSKQMLDLTGWSKSTLWRHTRSSGKLSHIKITALGENSPPLYDKSKFRAYLKNNNDKGQSSFRILSFHDVGKDASSPTRPYADGNGGDFYGQSLLSGG